MIHLYRNRFDRKVFGVIGGIALKFKVDANLLRLLFVFALASPLFLLFGALYILLAIVMPEGSRIMIENPAKKLYRPKKNRILSGICAGLGKHFNVDPLFVRLVYLSLLIPPLTYAAIISYIAGSVIIPEKSRLS